MKRRGRPRSARRRRASAGALVLLGLLGVPHAVAEEAGLPGSLTLTDPLRGTEETVAAGAPLLHVVFFATWCKPCLDELRLLAELEAQWGDRGYRLVLVAVPTRQTAEHLADFARTSRPPGRLLFDPNGGALRALGVERLPGHVLLGPQGELVLRAESLREGVLEAIERRLGSRPGQGRLR